MRNKIDYGIDLGTTNSAISRMENGVPKIFKADDQKDITPSCVSFNRLGAILVGQTAVNTGNNEAVYALRAFKEANSNTFKEFKRTMGTSVLYKSSYLKQELSSKELSAEVLKKLKTLVMDENVTSVVITIPAKFSNQQCEDTMQAAKIAGFKQVRLLQEPVAAATAYGLEGDIPQGYWLVFDFGGGTFDAALIKTEDGILVVKDTEGDNWLGGKNLDEKIIEDFLIPYLNEHYSIQFILKDPQKRELLCKFLKSYAEEVKNQLSFKDEYSLVTDLGAFQFEDENGEEPMFDLKVTSVQLEKALKPLFQKAIDITLGLLKRNNLTGADLKKLILVGGPTFSPILRKMLREQVTQNIDTSVDPMTVVSKGAAIFASSIDVEDDVKNITRSQDKLQLDVKYEGTSVEDTELVTLKIISGSFPVSNLTAEITRGDGAWSSNRFSLSEKTNLQEVSLAPKKANVFSITVYDEYMNRIDCEPHAFTILHGMAGLDSMQVLPYHIGIIKYFAEEDKEGFFPINGLSKNTPYPVTGISDVLKTGKAIKAATDDSLLIPLYQGDYNALGSDARLNNHIFDLKITGADLPENLPENSPVHLTVKVNESSLMKVTVDFPQINFSVEKDIQIRPLEPLPIEDLRQSLSEACRQAESLELFDQVSKLKQLEQELNHNTASDDTRLRVQNEWRKELQNIQQKQGDSEWPDLEKSVKDSFFELEDLISMIQKKPSEAEKNNVSINRITMLKEELKQKLEKALEKKDRMATKRLKSEITTMQIGLTMAVASGEVFVDIIQSWDRDFSTIHWANPVKARELINRGLFLISQGNTDSLRSLCFEIGGLMPKKERPNLLR